MDPSKKNARANNLPLPLQPPPAFTIYAPHKPIPSHVSYCARAWQILSLWPKLKASKKDPRSTLYSVLLKWKELVDQKNDPKSTETKDYDSGSRYIDKIKSGKRWYGVRGILVYDDLPSESGRQESYLFMFERLVPDRYNLAASFRNWELNTREQELVRLLMAGQSNIEIANHLDISINTVKGYLKLLMRKLGVKSRTKIISRLLTGKNAD